ncbi:hypothetical protein DYB25_001499 [Aphanomyces astaci]|uniref:Uncharacterized protein n=1 Tax=Aphanomyces astaci TaxID=112090 RepID=A0A397A2M7_APHAT|nr:hypothetical protein DYB25_001499 [Aphanomyces astaci]RHY33715.1 hypothetical protein DYB34_001764 [Aphanomyces astaci]RHY45557.1 hypothetical protein DYB30_005439 [Aphanomyces astaci]RHY57142.1 hypothetical protein DYB38_001765 [Aphanomyces astaci]RHY85771.1 hypothetical protein DYB26_004383 [Aphanomyces astaci]
MRSLLACLRVFVRVPLYQALIQLICAATTLTSTWHGQILQMICIQRLHVSASYGLVTVGGDGLRGGCLALAKYVPVVLPKVLRLMKATDLTGGMPRILHSLVAWGDSWGRNISRASHAWK